MALSQQTTDKKDCTQAICSVQYLMKFYNESSYQNCQHELIILNDINIYKLVLFIFTNTITYNMYKNMITRLRL
jgi:hypothetical protein